MSLLSDRAWKPKYDSDERDLVRDFFVPALESAVRYDRTTGYFTAGVLTLAARGVEGLVRNDGRMRLVVGCTLDRGEADAIARGEDLRATVGARLAAAPLAPKGQSEEAALELLAWLVARGFLEVKVALPCTLDRRACEGTAIFHEKTGVVEDKTGDRLAFSGSLNETTSGWTANWESFYVFTSWKWGGEHLLRAEDDFSKLWADKMKRCLVVDVPHAVREDLLRFLPKDGDLPRRVQGAEAALDLVGPAQLVDDPNQPVVADDELRRIVWGIIRHGPALPGPGDRVGEATSIVVPWPHQVRAFERLYRSWPPRLLIADEVGLGKTIEAGLLLRQACLAGRAKRVLVLAPKAVLRQWQIELREKFNLNWPIYDGHSLSWYDCHALAGRSEKKAMNGEWREEPFILVSSQLMRRAERARDLLDEAAPHWDLVVLDEAHHARRRGIGATTYKGPNKLLALMQRLRDKTQGLILLTATPMQVDPRELWDLLRLLGLPQEWGEDEFTQFFGLARHPNPSNDELASMARLFRASERQYGEIDPLEAARLTPKLSDLARKKVLRALRSGALTDIKQLETEKRRAAIRLMVAATPVARLVSRHTRELLRRYYHAGKMTSRIADRSVSDEFVQLSDPERAVSDAVEHYISTTYQQAADAERNAVGFVLTTYQRRLASSFAALANTLERRLSGLGASEEDVDDDETLDESMDSDDVVLFQKSAEKVLEPDAIRELLDSVRRLPKIDTKATVLAAELRKLLDAGYTKTMVFTQYTDTLDFLRDFLVDDLGLEVLCFSGRGGELRDKSGSWKVVARDDVKRIFREGSAQVLLCTDAAAEGLNFQFCGALVNYDMPWNPMRVEQRIGRIDRLGQRHESIRIVNLYYKDSVETDVYSALRQRTGLFTRYVGRLQPILAVLPRSLAAAALAGHPEGERDRILADLEARIREQDERGFDLDAVTDADLEEPPRPAPLYDLDALDELIRRRELLPPGYEIESLGHREYKISMPGMAEALRVTTRAEFFEDHPGSAELWSPGSPLFPDVEELAGPIENPVRSLREVLSGASPDRNPG